jgi:hypothetical protein
MKTEALKLADQLENDGDDFYRFMASAMIRRLVEELDKQGEPFGYLCDWGDDSYGLTRQTFYYGERGSPTLDDWNEYPKVHHNLPLYTTPQTKPLSDEEIKTLHEQTSWFGISDPIKFAKAILKKASEK